MTIPASTPVIGAFTAGTSGSYTAPAATFPFTTPFLLPTGTTGGDELLGKSNGAVLYATAAMN